LPLEQLPDIFIGAIYSNDRARIALDARNRVFAEQGRKKDFRSGINRLHADRVYIVRASWSMIQACLRFG